MRGFLPIRCAQGQNDKLFALRHDKLLGDAREREPHTYVAGWGFLADALRVRSHSWICRVRSARGNAATTQHQTMVSMYCSQRVRPEISLTSRKMMAQAKLRVIHWRWGWPLACRVNNIAMAPVKVPAPASAATALATEPVAPTHPYHHCDQMTQGPPR